MSTIGNEIVKNKVIIIAICILIFLFIIFFVHLYFNIRALYFPQKKENTIKETLFYKRLKYIIIFAIFLIVLTILYLVNPNDVMSNYFGSIILVSIMIGTLIITMISWYNYAYKKEGEAVDTKLSTTLKEKNPPPVNYFYRSLIFLLFGGIFAIVLYFLVYLIDPLSSTNSVVSWILNIVIIIIILALVYKIFNINNNRTILGFIMTCFSFIKQFFFIIINFIIN